MYYSPLPLQHIVSEFSLLSRRDRAWQHNAWLRFHYTYYLGLCQLKMQTLPEKILDERHTSRIVLTIFSKLALYNSSAILLIFRRR